MLCVKVCPPALGSRWKAKAVKQQRTLYLNALKKKVIKTNNFHNYKHVTSPIIFSWELGGKEIFQALIIRWIN